MQGMHSAGLVHRDVKPTNIIFAEGMRRFKLIDLGACADLRTGTNYVPDESILDPTYCPPEQVLPPPLTSPSTPVYDPPLHATASITKAGFPELPNARHRCREAFSPACPKSTCAEAQAVMSWWWGWEGGGVVIPHRALSHSGTKSLGIRRECRTHCVG